MFPGVDGFHWTPGHLIFLGAFFSVLAVIAGTVTIVIRRALRDRDPLRLEALRWHAVFHDLPRTDCVCRHELTGEMPGRICRLGFDCRQCQTHTKWIAAHPAPEGNGGRMYHRGHSWAQIEADGAIAVGLDDLGRQLIGTPDAVEFPPIGGRVAANGTAWRIVKNGAVVRVLCPVDGEVLAIGGPDAPWYLRIQPAWPASTAHLLRGAEIEPWIGRESQKLQEASQPEALASIFLQ